MALCDADNDPTVTDIRVAEGAYLPTDGDEVDQIDIRAEFDVTNQSNLRLLGGFPDGGGAIEDVIGTTGARTLTTYAAALAVDVVAPSVDVLNMHASAIPECVERRLFFGSIPAA